MSLAVRRAIYGKMSGDVTLNALLGTPADTYSKSIYYQQAPEGAGYPLVIFSKQSSTPRYALAERALDSDIWMVKGVSFEEDGGAADAADSISARLDALLTDATLSISGATALYFRRESDLDYIETTDDGRVYRHAGSNFRLIYD